MFHLVRKSVLEEKAKLNVATGTTNPKGDETYRFDLRAEEIAINYCKENFDFPIIILSEECGEILTKEGEPKYTFIIDPVDGSRNFKRGIEISGFSIGAIPAGKPLAVQNVEFALVGSFFTGSVYKAEKEKGCYFNNAKAKTSQTTDIEKAFICIDPDAEDKEKRKRFLKLLNIVGAVRRLGSASLELSAVAVGALDGHVDLRDDLTPENFMAAYLLINEAGGVFTDPCGKELPPIKSLTEVYCIAAAGNKELHKKILELIEM